MSAPSVVVNNSTSVVLIDTSVLTPGDYALVYMSSVQYAGTLITVKDIAGFASLTKPIVISTTAGVQFQDGRFSTFINQPYGFITFASFAGGSIWQVLNTFAFSNQSEAAYVRNFTTDVANITTTSVVSMNLSTLSTYGVYIGNTLSSGGSTIFGETNVLSNLLVRRGISTLSQLNASSLTINTQTTTSSLLVSGNSLFQNSIIARAPTTFDTQLSISGPLIVVSPTTLQSTLIVSSLAVFQDTVSSLKSIAIADSLFVSCIQTPLTVNNSFQVVGPTTFRGPLSFTNTVRMLADLEITASTTLSSILTVKDQALFHSNISTLGQLMVHQSSIFMDSVFIANRLTTNTIQQADILTSLFTRSSALISTNLTVQNTLEVQNSALFQSNVSTLGPLAQVGPLTQIAQAVFQSTVSMQGPLSVQSLTTLSHLSIQQSVVIAQNLSTQGTAVVGGVFRATNTAVFQSNVLQAASLSTVGFTTLSSFFSQGDGNLTGDLRVNGTLFVNRVNPVSADMVFDSALQLKDTTRSVFPMQTNSWYFVNNFSTLYLSFSTFSDPVLSIDPKISEFRLFDNCNYGNIYLNGSLTNRITDVSPFQNNTADLSFSFLPPSDGGLSNDPCLQIRGGLSTKPRIDLFQQIPGISESYSFRIQTVGRASSILQSHWDLDARSTGVTLYFYGSSLGINKSNPAVANLLDIGGRVNIDGALTVGGSFTTDTLNVNRISPFIAQGSIDMNRFFNISNVNQIITSSILISSAVLIGADRLSSINSMRFFGTFNDGAAPTSSNFTHTVIAENIWGTGAGNEQSELLLFKGNDFDTTSGPDRVRVLAGGFQVDLLTAGQNWPLGSPAPTTNIATYLSMNGSVGVKIHRPLDMSGSNITNAGTITATSFSGNATSATTATTANGLNSANSYTVAGLTTSGTVQAGTFQGGTLQGRLNVNVDSWHTSGDGRNRLYFANNGTTYFGTASSYAWQNINNNIDIMTLNNNGNLNITGSMTASGDITAFSDRRFKTNIMPISNALSTVLEMRGVFYNRIEPELSSIRKLGVIAQELETVLPEVVNTDTDVKTSTQTKSVAYGNITAILIEAIKELNQKVDALLARTA